MNTRKLSEATRRWVELEERIVQRRAERFDRTVIAAALMMMVNATTYSYAAFRILMF